MKKYISPEMKSLSFISSDAINGLPESDFEASQLMNDGSFGSGTWSGVGGQPLNQP